jgi:putative membrane protein
MILWIKVVHIVAVISWMAGLLYLPRLFVYHVEAGLLSPQAATFKVMQERLLRVIMRPAMVVVWLTGPLLVWQMGYYRDGWVWLKILLVVGLSGVHGQMVKWHRELAAGTSTHNSKFFRIINEIPTVLMIAIVILVVIKPL